jgi:hypothetical protein
MAVNIHRRRHAGDMGGEGFDMYGQGGSTPAETLRPNTQIFISVKIFCSSSAKAWIRVAARPGAAAAFLASTATLSKVPPMPTPTTIGGQGLGPRP